MKYHMMMQNRQFDGYGVHAKVWVANINLGIVSMYPSNWYGESTETGGMGRNTGAPQINKQRIFKRTSQ